MKVYLPIFRSAIVICIDKQRMMNRHSKMNRFDKFITEKNLQTLIFHLLFNVSWIPNLARIKIFIIKINKILLEKEREKKEREEEREEEKEREKRRKRENEKKSEREKEKKRKVDCLKLFIKWIHNIF